MALIDTYQNNIKRKQNELLKLNEDKLKEENKIYEYNKKIMNAKSTITKTKSQSTKESKIKEIQRYDNNKINIIKKINDISKKISKKQIEINLENNKLEKEKNRVTKKQIQLEEKRIRESEKKMKEILNKPTAQYINNGGQMNIASDNATIHATYNEYNDKDELAKILENIKSKDISRFSEEDAETLEDSIDSIEQEFKNDEPKKGVIRMAIKGLTSILHVSSELTEPLQKLIDFVGNNIK